MAIVRAWPVVAAALFVVGVSSVAAQGRRRVTTNDGIPRHHTRRGTRALTDTVNDSVTDSCPAMAPSWNSGECVCTANQLRRAIQAAPKWQDLDSTSDTDTSGSSRVVLCRSSHIQLDQAMDVSNKDITLQCGSSRLDLSLDGSNELSCTLDGMAKSRLFVGTNARLSLYGIRVVRGLVTAGYNGGAWALVRSNLTLEDCHVAHHAAVTGAGGALYLVGGRLNSTRTVWFNNTAQDGGAMAIKRQSVVRLVSNVLSHNTARAGGAGIFQRSIVVTQDTYFTDNTALSTIGGALALQNVRMNLDRATFSGNVAQPTALSWDITIMDDASLGEGGTALICQGTVFCTNRSSNSTMESGGQTDNTNCDASRQTADPGLCPVTTN